MLYVMKILFNFQETTFFSPNRSTHVLTNHLVLVKIKQRNENLRFYPEKIIQGFFSYTHLTV